MITKNFKLMNKNQKGFTLIEVLIALAITAVIVASVTVVFFQVFTGNTRTSNHMTAVRQVQNAGYWVSHDGQMAQSIIFDDPATSGVTEFLTLTWTDTVWDGSKVHRVAYTLVDMPSGGLKNLQRSYSVNATAQGNGIIAQFIDPALTKVEWGLTGGGGFSLPDIGDAFTITGGAVAGSGTITVTAPSDIIKATPLGGATVAGGTSEVTINKNSGAVPWTTPAGGGQIIVERVDSSAGLVGIWTAPTGTATAAITSDADGDASITGSGGMLTFTVTATVGSGSQQGNETRVYEVVPRPGS